MEQYPVKVAMLGSMGVGKTKMVERFCRNTFSDPEGTTIGAEMCVKKFTLADPNASFDITIWDTSGQEQYRSICRHYYRCAQAIVLVYDTTSKASFDDLPDWMIDLRQNVPDALVILAGNKCDKLDEEVVRLEEAKEFAKSIKAEHFLTSAKDGTNINELFKSLCRQLLEHHLVGPQVPVYPLQYPLLAW